MKNQAQRYLDIGPMTALRECRGFFFEDFETEFLGERNLRSIREAEIAGRSRGDLFPELPIEMELMNPESRC